MHHCMVLVAIENIRQGLEPVVCFIVNSILLLTLDM